MGPLFYYELVLLTRRGRSTFVRVLYAVVLLVVLARLYAVYVPLPEAQRRALAMRSSSDPQIQVSPRDNLARFAEQFVIHLLVVQNLAVFFLVPIYVAPLIPEERERRTLDLLFTTHLTDSEIVLGKLFARLVFLGGILLGGLPILALVQLWGGVDMPILWCNFALTAVNLIAVGCLCSAISAAAPSMTQAVLAAYAVVAPGLTCVTCMRWEGFSPLLIWPSLEAADPYAAMGQSLLNMSLAGFAGGGLCLLLAVTTLRDREGQHSRPGLATELKFVEKIDSRRGEKGQAGNGPRVETVLVRLHTPPPVGEDPLLWKEMHLGGPPWTRSPLLLFPLLVFAGPVLAICLAWATYLFLGRGEAPHMQVKEVVQMFAGMCRLVTFVLLGLASVAAALRAAASVARERQNHSLDSLLVLPWPRGDMLRAKWLAALWRGHGWIYIAVGGTLADAALTGLAPLSVLLRLTLPAVHLVFLASLGLAISVSSRSVLQAYLRAGFCLAALVMGPLLFDLLVTGTPGHSWLHVLSPPELWHAITFGRQDQGPYWLGARGATMVLGAAVFFMTASLLCWSWARWRWQREGR